MAPPDAPPRPHCALCVVIAIILHPLFLRSLQYSLWSRIHKSNPLSCSLFGGGGLYTQQERALSRRLHPGEAARPALMGRAAHSVEANQSRGPPHRSRRPPTPLPGLRCGTRLAHHRYAHVRGATEQGTGTAPLESKFT
jgi:hypothetical protein